MAGTSLFMFSARGYALDMNTMIELRAKQDPEAKVRRKDTTFLLLLSSEKVS